MGTDVETTQEGDGVTYPQEGQSVLVHYIGTLAKNGKQFDSSHSRGQPLTFSIGFGQVIKCWDEGIARMSKGERATLTCSPEVAYGKRGFPPRIPGNATLKFDVELVDIQ